MFKIDEKLSKEIVAKTSVSVVKSYEIGGNNYFVKIDNELKEVIGYRLAQLLGINCIKYESININGFHYSVSRDINELSEFILLEEIICDDHDLVCTIKDIMKYTKNSLNLIPEILKVYVYDILFLNDDRHPANWGLIKANEKYKIIIFDNQNIFTLIYPPFIRFNNDLFLGNNLQDNAYMDLEQFLENCPLDYHDLIYDLILQADIKYIEMIFNEIERKYCKTIDSNFLKGYTEHYTIIRKIVERKRDEYYAR